MRLGARTCVWAWVKLFAWVFQSRNRCSMSARSRRRAAGRFGAADGAGPGAWVDLRRGWLTGSGAVFARLAEAVPWRAERRQMYDQVVACPGCSASTARTRRCPTRCSTPRGRRSTRTTGRSSASRSRTAGLCLYRDGRDSVGLARRHDRARPERGHHGGDLVPGHAAAAAAAPAGGRSWLGPLRFELGHGDLLVMGGSCQRTWEHAVPKTARPAGPRISVQFRPRGVSAEPLNR